MTRLLITLVLLGGMLAGCAGSGVVASEAAGAGAGPAAPGSAATGTTAEVHPIRVVDAGTAAQLLQDEPDRVVIDIRTPAEYAEGHLADAQLIDFQAPDFSDRVDALDRDATYLIYCRSGNRSAGARAIMAELGFNDVVDIGGGILDWNAAGLPITS